MADVLLSFLANNDGRANTDMYFNYLVKKFGDTDYYRLSDFVINDLIRDKCIEYVGTQQYWIALTPKGAKVAGSGIEKLQKAIENQNNKKDWSKIGAIATIISVLIAILIYWLSK